MKVWRTEDANLLRSIATHPRAWPRIASDGIDPGDYEPVIHPRVHYLTDGTGFFSWRPLSTVAYEGHIVHLGGEAEAFARAACRWMSAEGALKLVVMPPRFNWHARKLAEAVGFQREGVLTSCMMWRGRLHDLIVMGKAADGSNR